MSDTGHPPRADAPGNRPATGSSRSAAPRPERATDDAAGAATPKPGKPQGADDREARLAAALRANLRRRKAAKTSEKPGAGTATGDDTA